MKKSTSFPIIHDKYMNIYRSKEFIITHRLLILINKNIDMLNEKCSGKSIREIELIVRDMYISIYDSNNIDMLDECIRKLVYRSVNIDVIAMLYKFNCRDFKHIQRFYNIIQMK